MSDHLNIGPDPSVHFIHYWEGLEDILASVHRAGFSQEEAWSAKAFRDVLTLPVYGICAYVSDHDQQIKGFLLYTRLMEEAEIITFVVLPDARRQGIGKAVLRAFMDVMKQQEVTRIFLEVAEDNQAACALYEQQGFQVQGRRSDYYGQGRHAFMMVARP